MQISEHVATVRPAIRFFAFIFPRRSAGGIWFCDDNDYDDDNER